VCERGGQRPVLVTVRKVMRGQSQCRDDRTVVLGKFLPHAHALPAFRQTNAPI